MDGCLKLNPIYDQIKVNIMKTIIKTFALILLLFLIRACTFSAVKMQFTASSHINPDIKNRALPVLIRVYQLSQADIFNHATFQQLWLNDDQALGSSLIKRQEIILNPKSTAIVNIIPDENAHYIGVIALYRNPKQSQWRIIQAMPSKIAAMMSSIHVVVAGNKITFITTPQDK